jgi:hypothetical protein
MATARCLLSPWFPTRQIKPIEVAHIREKILQCRSAAAVGTLWCSISWPTSATWFVADSLLERDGFEPSVTRKISYGFETDFFRLRDGSGSRRRFVSFRDREPQVSLLAHSRLPLGWHEQRTGLGFA